LSQFFRNLFARIGVSALWIVSFLPYSFLMKLGDVLGIILYHLISKRRKVAIVNLKLCFPELSPAEVINLSKEHFKAMGKAIFELSICWFWSDKRLKPLFHISGSEHLKSALSEGKGVILLSAHFTTLEIGGRLISYEKKIDAVYRKHKSSFLEKFVKSKRKSYTNQTIQKTNIREMLKSLKKNHIVWYAPDQNFTGKNSVLTDFFKQPAPSNPGTVRMAKITDAKIVPYVQYRRSDGQGYDCKILPALSNFPSSNDLDDLNRINKIFEEFILEQPSHYYWLHKRFKNLPTEYKDVYKDI